MVEIQHRPHFGVVRHLIFVQDPWLRKKKAHGGDAAPMETLIYNYNGI